MKILYITAEGFDTPNPNNQMAEVMIGDFLQNGYSVHLIESRRKRINSDIPESLLDKANFTYDIVERSVVDKTNFIKRYLNEVKYAFSSMKYWIKIKDADVIYLQSNPTILFSMLLLKIFNRAPIVYSIYDVFPGHAFDIGVIKSKFIYNCLNLLQKPCYKLASIITVLSEDMQNKVIELGAKSNKVKVVPAWFDIKTAHEIQPDENKFIQKYNINKDKFYVQFAGTVGYVFNYHTIIELAKKLVNEKNIIIQIVGDGNIKNKFIDEANKSNLNNIVFYPLQPLEIVPDVYSTCNVCIIPLQKGVIGNGVPSKAPILMACKRVIVNSVESNSIYSKIFSENDMGISVDIDDIDGLKNAILSLYHSPQMTKRMAENAYLYGQNHYTSTKSTKLFMNIFDELSASNIIVEKIK